MSDDEVEQLRKECFALAAGLCPHQYGDEYGHSQCREIDRLRAALSEIDVILHTPTSKTRYRTAAEHFAADCDALRRIVKLALTCPDDPLPPAVT